MKYKLLLLFCLLTTMVKAQNNIAAYEYWFDTNYANKVSIPVTGTAQVQIDTGISTDGLSTGLHIFHIRFRDTADVWSSTKSQMFLKRSSVNSNNSTNVITAYRYWADTFVNAIQTVYLDNPSPQSFVLTQLNLANLDTGLHKIYIQFKDTVGSWSSVIVDSFYQLGKPRIDLITPNKGGNIGYVTTTIYGTGFYDSTTVKLTRTGYPDITVPDSMMTITNGQVIKATLNLIEKDTGYWNVVVTVPNDTVMTVVNGFKIETGIYPTPLVSIVGPAAIRPGGDGAIFNITVTNNGNIDAEDVPVWFAINDTLASVEFLFSVNRTLPPGITPPPDFIPVSEVPGQPEGQPYNGQATGFNIPNIPPNSSASLPVRVNSNNNLDMRAWGNNPRRENGSMHQNIANCLEAIFDAALGIYGNDITDCLNGLRKIYKDYSSDGDTELELYDYGRTFYHCYGIFNPTRSMAEGVVDLILDIVDDNSLVSSVANGCKDIFEPNNLAIANLGIINSWDPNDKYGIIGGGTSNSVTQNTPLFYNIQFENDTSATAPAQVVLVIDTLDTAVYNLNTFQLGSFYIADTFIHVPAGLKQYKTWIDYRPYGNNIILQVEAGLNDTTGVAKWLFTTLDPNTMQATQDPFAGFLPPNNVSPEGQGGVFFSIKAKDNLPNNTVISNKAYIYFDNNAPIVTGTWSNTLDNIKPVSAVDTLPVYTLDTTFTVSWGGYDTSSGIRHYAVYASTNGGPYQLWKYRTSDTSAVFTGAFDSTYSFYTVATDTAGNKEDIPLQYDAITKLIKCSDRLHPVLDTIGYTSICNGDSLLLVAGGGNYYTWSNGESTDTLVIRTAGNYTLVVSDTFGCTASLGTTEVLLKPDPVIAITVSRDSVCYGSGIIINVSGAASYAWNYNNSTGDEINVTPLTDSWYSVTATGDNACSVKDSVFVRVLSLPDVRLTADSVSVCYGDTVQLEASGAVNYTWFPVAETNPIIRVSPAVSTQFSIEGTDAFGCSNRDSVYVTVLELPVVRVTASGDSICLGDTVLLVASGAETYSWGSLSQHTDSVWLSPGWSTRYFVSGTDRNGCSNTDSVMIAVKSLPQIMITTNKDTICAGDTITLHANGGITYQWLPVSGSSVILTDNPPVTSIYYLTGWGGNGCSNKDSLQVVVADLPATPVITRNGDILYSSYPAGNQWYKNNTLIPGATNSSLSLDDVGAYRVKYTNEQGCFATSGITVIEALSINLLEEDVSVIAVYPNPTEGNFIIKGEHLRDKQISCSIYNPVGQKVRALSIPVTVNGFTETVNISGLASGVYTIVISTEVSTKVFKLTKQ